jgi:hypothetical protein
MGCGILVDVIGCARTLTVEWVAGLGARICDLAAAGCKTICKERASSVDNRQTQLKVALYHLMGSGVFMVTKPGHLARSIRDARRQADPHRPRHGQTPAPGSGKSK